MSLLKLLGYKQTDKFDILEFEPWMNRFISGRKAVLEFAFDIETYCDTRTICFKEVGVDKTINLYLSRVKKTSCSTKEFAVGNEVPKEENKDMPVNEAVRNPSHYKVINDVEAIDLIAGSMTEVQWEGYCLGNIMKYRLRAGNKDKLEQDIGKADFYKELYETKKYLCRK